MDWFLHMQLSCCQNTQSCQRSVKEWLLGREKTCRHGSHGIFHAIRENNITLVAMLAAEDGVLGIETKFGDTALSFACSQGRAEVVRLILEQSGGHSDLANRETRRGKTALLEAIREGHGDIVQILLPHANPHQSVHGRSALEWARLLKQNEISDLIEDHLQLTASVSTLLAAIARRDEAKIREMTSGGDAFNGNIYSNSNGSASAMLALQSYQLLHLSQNQYETKASSCQAESAKAALETQVKETTEIIQNLADERRRILSDHRTTMVSAALIVRSSCTERNAAELNTAVDSLPLQFELIAKAFCLLLYIKVDPDPGGGSTYWEAIKEMLRNDQLVHRLSHYHISLDQVQLVRACILDGLPGECCDCDHMISGILNGMVEGSVPALIMAIAKWTQTVLEQAIKLSKERELMMSESDTSNVLERMKTDLEVSTSRCTILREDLKKTRDFIDKTSGRITALKRRIYVSNVMNTIQRGGHSVLSYAAAVGDANMVRLLIKRGAHTVIGEDCKSWCATLIQIWFRSLVAKKDGLPCARWSLRMKSLSNLIRQKLRGLRLPLAEAAFNGHLGSLKKALDQSDLSNLQALNLLPLVSTPIAMHPRLTTTTTMPRHLYVHHSQTCQELLLFIVVEAGRTYQSEAFVQTLKCAVQLVDEHLTRREAVLESKLSARKDTLINQHKRRYASKLSEAIKHADFAAMLQASECGELSLDHEDPDTGMTPLICAAMESSSHPPNLFDSVGEPTTAVAYLLDRISQHQPSVDHENRLGHTPLMMACSHGRMRPVQDLIARGVDINRQSSVTGQTPLVCACKEGRLNIVKILSSHGANFDLVDKNGMTAQDHAMRSACPALL